MITMITGIKYNFQIVSQTEEQDCIFYIRAVAKSNRKTSCINNLNAILSELDIDLEDRKFEDSTWLVTKEEAQYFSDTAIEFLSDASFLNYIERKLDEDRMVGEWENVI